MKLNTQTMIDFIVVNGWYPDFKKFCYSTTAVRSKKRLAYLFLCKINRIKMFKAISCCPLNLYDVVKVKWL